MEKKRFVLQLAAACLVFLCLGCQAQPEEDPTSDDGLFARIAALTCRGGPGCGPPESAFPGGAFWPRNMRPGRPPALAPSCSSESQCPEGMACLSGVCGPCTEHAQCRSDVCDRYAATSMGPGACLTEDQVVYVDGSNRPACETGSGAHTSPLCTIGSAIPLANGRRYAIRVFQGSYPPFSVTDRTLFVYGPMEFGFGHVVIGQEDAASGVRAVRSRLVLDGVSIGVHVLTGVRSEDSDVQLRRVTVTGDFQGVASVDSSILLDRADIRGSSTYGVKISGAGTYEITNSYLRGRDYPAMIFEGTNTGRFLFNSVLSGGALNPGGIDCGTSARVIQDSIVYGNTPGAGGAQTVGACTHQRVVVGSNDTRSLPGLIKINPEIDAYGRLNFTQSDVTCCINKGERYVPSLYHDFFGAPRPRGASNDIGAHEMTPLITTMHASADTQIRTDLDLRANDNYGCQEIMEVGTSRGGGGIPLGGADAMRALVRFGELSVQPWLAPFVSQVSMRLQLDSFEGGSPTSVYQIGAHAVLPSGGLTPWAEGNGVEGTFVPGGCVDVDSASGVDWIGQPNFSPTATAIATVNQATHVRGNDIWFDLTTLTRQWIAGTTTNHGIVFRDTTTDGTFRGVRFGTRDGQNRGFPSYVLGPFMIIVLAP